MSVLPVSRTSTLPTLMEHLSELRLVSFVCWKLGLLCGWVLGNTGIGNWETYLEVEAPQLLLALLVLLVTLLGIFGEFLHIRLNL